MKSQMVVLMAHYRRLTTSLLNLDQQFCHCLDSRTGLDGIMNYLQLWNVVTRFTRSDWQVELLCCAAVHAIFRYLCIKLQVGHPVWVELCLKIWPRGIIVGQVDWLTIIWGVVCTQAADNKQNCKSGRWRKHVNHADEAIPKPKT